MASARQILVKTFYNKLQNKSKYKLINDSFIVKNLGNGIYDFVAMLNSEKRYSNRKKHYFVTYLPFKQRFNPSKKLQTKHNRPRVWEKLEIKWNVKPISAILK